MKSFSFFLIAILISAKTFAGYTTDSFSHDGIMRQYMLYVPASYNSSTPVPFVLALHGLGSSMSSFSSIDMNLVADTANFIFAIPQALVDSVLTHETAWNSGAGNFGVSLNPNVDDIGFLNALIDTISSHYNIDQTRIYSTGFSMGGFMSNRLACELNNRIAAIASVSGTIGNELNCQPTRAIPVAHFHGTDDPVVGYTNDLYGLGAEALVAYWVNHNHCDTTPASIDTFPNIANDGKVVVHYKYLHGDYGTRVEFFKVIGGVHEWLTIPGNDINYSVEIWRFFRDFQWTQQVSGIKNTSADENAITVFPNPASDFVNVQLPETKSNWTITLYDLAGRQLFSTFAENASGNIRVPLSNLSAGIYSLQFSADDLKVNKKLVIEE